MLTKDSTGYYLDATSGQYYQPYTPPAPSKPRGYMSMGGFVPQSNVGMSSIGLGSINPSEPKGIINYDGASYIPFTGSALGINDGKRSMVYQAMQNKQPYQYNAPSLESLFGSGFQGFQGNEQGGAGQFLGGLLAPQGNMQGGSSGAGRFL